MIWRREAGKDLWHFCKNCPAWPTTGKYEEDQRLPLTGRMCEECRAKKDRGDCQEERRPVKSG